MSTIMGISGWRFDLAAACQSRGEVTINAPDGIMPAEQVEIEAYNDLAALLEVRDILTQLETAVSAIARMTTEGLISFSQALTAVEGETGFEKYLNALQTLCGTTEGVCSGLMRRTDQALALQRLQAYQRAAMALDEINFSDDIFNRLVALESGDTTGVTRTLAAVNALISQMAGPEELGLAEEDVTLEHLRDEIAGHCQAGVQEVPVIPPPVRPPQGSTVPTLPTARYHLLDADCELTAGYPILVSGDRSSLLPTGPSLDGHVEGDFNVRRMGVRVGWDGQFAVDNFGNFVSDASLDVFFAGIDFGDNYVGAAFLWGRSRPDTQQYLGSLTYERDILGWLRVGGSVLVGVNSSGEMVYGAAVGLTADYYSQRTGIDVEGTVLETMLYGGELDSVTQFSGTVSYRLATFRDHVARVGVETAFAYDSASGDTVLVPAVTLEIVGEDSVVHLPGTGEL